MKKTILIVGTYDTKSDELRFIEQIIVGQGGATLTMDVSVLHNADLPADVSKHAVAAAANSSIEAAIGLNDENGAMQIMSRGASVLAAQLYQNAQVDGVIILGGTMGTDLALDVCLALPLGVPKYIVSTVSFSPMLPPDRIASDVQMILWAGGLYGLNSICKASLSQAAGAVLGAARSTQHPDPNKPMIGMTSFGKATTRFMVTLKPALEERGFEVAVFHATGMGGRAFENLIAQGRFSCVLDLATQEVGNHIFGSDLSAGAERLTSAGRTGTPQIVAPGCHDLVDVIGWKKIDNQWDGYETHAHNRLLTSVVITNEDRKKVAKSHADRLACSIGKTAFIMPLGGCHEWDRAGAPLHNPNGIVAFAKAVKPLLGDHIEWAELDAHINDPEFCDIVLTIFDRWFPNGSASVQQPQSPTNQNCPA